MPSVRVQYTVRPEFVDTNKANIARVMADLREADHSGIRYVAFVLPDGVTFMHVAMFADAEARGALGQLESFQAFQAQLKASGLVSPPDPKPLEFVASSWALFD